MGLLEYNFGGKAQYRLVLVKKKGNNEYERIRVIKFNPGEQLKKVRFGSWFNGSMANFEINVKNCAWHTENNRHFLYLDVDSGETLTFFNKIQPSTDPIDGDTLNNGRLVKIFANAVSNNYGLIVPILCAAVGIFGGFLLGAYMGPEFFSNGGPPTAQP